MAIFLPVAVMLMGVCAGGVRGHGMVIDPPQRGSMWRFGYNTPQNYDDNQLFCGGFNIQWNKNGGKCGICGDRYDADVRPHEAGGKYATGIIVKTYTEGQIMDIAIRITANHKGYFRFKICPNNNVKVEATEECLNSHVLTFVDNNGVDIGQRYMLDDLTSVKKVRVRLPTGLTCTQCVLQWTYNTGNSWGCDFDDSTHCCVGCGRQENFVNCIDIAVTGANANSNTKVPDPNTARITATPTIATNGPPPTTATTTTHVHNNTNGTNCVAVEPYSNDPKMTNWCIVNCAAGYCPPSHCKC